MPLNCTQAFSDGTVNFAGGVTGYANDGFTTTTTIYDQTGGLVGVTNSVGDTIIVGPEHGVLSTVTDPSGHTTTFTYVRRIGGAGHRANVEHDEIYLRFGSARDAGDRSARRRDDQHVRLTRQDDDLDRCGRRHHDQHL